MAATEELKVVITAETEKAKAQIKGVQSQLKGIGKFASGATSTISRAITKTLSGVKKSIKTGLKVIATMTGITMAAMIRSVFKMSGGSREWTKAINGLKASWLEMKKTMSSILQAVMIPFIKNMDKFIQKARIAAKAFAKVFNLELVESTNAAISKNMAGFDEINTISTEGGKESDKQILSDEEKADAEAFGKKWGDKLKEIINNVKSNFDKIKEDVNDIASTIAGIATSVGAIAGAKAATGIAKDLTSVFSGIATFFGISLGKAGLEAWKNLDLSKIGKEFIEKTGISKEAIAKLDAQLKGPEVAKVLADKMGYVGKSTGLISAKFLIIAGLIAACVAGIVLLWQNSEEFRNGVAEFVGILKELWAWLQPQLSDLWESLKTFGKTLWDAIKALWTALKPVCEWIAWIFTTVVLVAIGAIASIITGLLKLIVPVITWVVDVITWIVNAVKEICDMFGKLFRGDFKGVGDKIKNWFKDDREPANYSGRFANGGFPSTGSLFVAREAGPEMVGTMGGATAVANNDQITNGIANAVYNAIVKAGGMGGGNANITLELDGEKIGKSVVNYNNNIVRRTGRSPLMA